MINIIENLLAELIYYDNVTFKINGDNNMLATVEFETDYRNGIFSIPQKIKNKVINHHLKVIMTYEEDEIITQKSNNKLVEFCGCLPDFPERESQGVYEDRELL